MDLQAIFAAIVTFISGTLIPFVMALAFFFFIWNAVRYFIIGGANPESQEKAKSLAIWGILAFVIITSLWGIVAIFTSSFGIDDTDPVMNDYMRTRVCEDPESPLFDPQACGAISPTDPCDPTTFDPVLCPGGA